MERHALHSPLQELNLWGGGLVVSQEELLQELAGAGAGGVTKSRQRAEWRERWKPQRQWPACLPLQVTVTSPSHSPGHRKAKNLRFSVWWVLLFVLFV